MDRSQLIRASFEVVADRSDALLARFYERLFDGRPQVRAMFPEDLGEQRRHLAAAVGLVVKHADNLDALAGALRDMGARHVGYGAQVAHYKVVRDVLVATLAEFAGEAWTPDIASAWKEALDEVTAWMLYGAATRGHAA